MKHYHNYYEIDQDDYFKKISFYISNGSYKLIGKGSARSVYDLENGRVVKIARNIKGIAQNMVEYNIDLNDDTGLFADVRAVSEDFHYLVMDKANEISDISYVWDYYNVRNNHELYQKIGYISSKYNLMLRDLGRAVNWGQIDGRPVIIDYGFTRQVSRRYYKRSIW
ncbi:MAG: hypothetical protein AAGU75_18065 [Bacillota bacterium]